jgi:hypothetical protein
VTSVPTTVAIPSLGETELLWPLLELLQRDAAVERIWVLDNGMGRDACDRLCRGGLTSKVERIDAHHLTIYEMWNLAALALKTRCRVANLALLNDDVALPPDAVSVLAEHLRAEEWSLLCPDWRRPLAGGVDLGAVEQVHGTYRHDGICGWCFVVRLEAWPGIDERYQWWFGDDHLVFELDRRGGRCGRLTGLPIDHAMSTTAVHHSWTEEAKVQDALTFAAQWGER